MNRDITQWRHLTFNGPSIKITTPTYTKLIDDIAKDSAITQRRKLPKKARTKRPSKKMTDMLNFLQVYETSLTTVYDSLLNVRF